ncbi:hypothetical protein Syun_021538 [Stephania yunnanensis]|uniref:Uncharacterized protein n=1 Tax=Stephania yunnanensis TaxID=152371 RepID=A0AAP0IFT7_9MAGN
MENCFWHMVLARYSTCPLRYSSIMMYAKAQPIVYLMELKTTVRMICIKSLGFVCESMYLLRLEDLRDDDSDLLIRSTPVTICGILSACVGELGSQSNATIILKFMNKSFTMYVHKLDRLQRRRLELTQATPDQPVDDEAVYLNVPGECPKGRVYGLGSLGRKKRRYANPGASTSQMPEMVPRAKFDIVAEQLRKVMAFMHQHLGMTMDGAGLSQPQPPPPPPPPPPRDQQQPPQIDPADPP